MSGMLAGRSSVEDFDFLIRQTEHTLMQCLRASKREAYETTEESAQRAMQMTMKAQKAQKQHAIFSAWYRTTMRGKIAEIEHYWKLQCAALKSKTSLGLQRALGAMSEKSSQAALKFVFEAWKEERAKSFQEKYRILLYEVKHKGAAQVKRILTHMCGNNDLVFARTIFIGWKDFVTEQLQKRREASWKSAISEMQQHSKHAVLQRTIAMFELQDDSLVRSYFSAWKDHWVEERLVRQKTTWLADHKEQKGRFCAAIKSRVYMQCYTQHSLLMKHVYGIWKDQYQRSRILRMEETLKDAHINTESMGAKLAEQKLKANDAVKRSLMAMLGSQSELILQSAFNGWRTLAYDARMRKQIELADRFQQGEKKWKQSMSCLLKDHDGLILRHIFETWRRTAMENYCERMREHVAQQKMKESKRFQQALMSMLESQDHLYFAQVVTRIIGDRAELMIQHVFRNWSRHTLAQAAQRWQKKYLEDTAKMKANTTKSVKRAALLWCDGQLEVLARHTFGVWAEQIAELRKKRALEEEQKKLKLAASKNLKKTMMSFFQANEHVLVQTVFSGWKDRWIGRQIAKVEKMKAAYDGVRDKAVMNGWRACEVTVYWENNYIVKSSFSAWKDLCVKESWRNSLAKWRDQFETLSTKVRQEATAKPTTVEQKLSCAEFELKGLLDALLKTHGLTQRDFETKSEMKEWVDSQVGFKSQLIVGPGQRGKENNPYFHIAAEHLSSVATHLASPATKASSNFSTRSRKPLYGNNAPEARV